MTTNPLSVWSHFASFVSWRSWWWSSRFSPCYALVMLLLCPCHAWLILHRKRCLAITQVANGMKNETRRHSRKWRSQFEVKVLQWTCFYVVSRGRINSSSFTDRYPPTRYCSSYCQSDDNSHPKIYTVSRRKWEKGIWRTKKTSTHFIQVSRMIANNNWEAEKGIPLFPVDY